MECFNILLWKTMYFLSGNKTKRKQKYLTKATVYAKLLGALLVMLENTRDENIKSNVL